MVRARTPQGWESSIRDSEKFVKASGRIEVLDCNFMFADGSIYESHIS